MHMHSLVHALLGSFMHTFKCTHMLVLFSIIPEQVPQKCSGRLVGCSSCLLPILRLGFRAYIYNTVAYLLFESSGVPLEGSL